MLADEKQTSLKTSSKRLTFGCPGQVVYSVHLPVALRCITFSLV